MTAFITRDLSDNSAFKSLLTARGWQVEGRSLVMLTPLVFHDIPAAGWIFFSSKNAVQFFFQNIENQKLAIPSVKWAALGEATAEMLKKYVGEADFTGDGDPVTTAEAFLGQPHPRLPQREGGRGTLYVPPPVGGGAGGGVVLFPAARHVRESIMSLLSTRFQCIHLEVYDNKPVGDPPASEADVLVFTSPMNAEAYFVQHVLQNKQQVVAIGRTTAEALKALGIDGIFISEEPSERSLAEAVLRLQR
ncbi:MAG: uroporphyrinogen-III synthase [Saprospiraceae bacterium]|nr:uroporphyrinogen-III synthase [Saprospiraceae bacterium]